MSNRYHLVLGTDVLRFSDEEVADRWLKRCPGRKVSAQTDDVQVVRRLALFNDAFRLDEIRARLSSLSWLMCFINEPFARLANKEDGCKDRFWGGRFNYQALLDKASVLACMVYVNLNPVSAKIADDPKGSEFTSIKQHCKSHTTQEPVEAINPTSFKKPPISITILGETIKLMKWTALRQSNSPKDIQHGVNRCLENGRSNMVRCFACHLPKAMTWRRAIGSDEALSECAKSINQLSIQRPAAVT